MLSVRGAVFASARELQLSPNQQPDEKKAFNTWHQRTGQREGGQYPGDRQRRTSGNAEGEEQARAYGVSLCGCEPIAIRASRPKLSLAMGLGGWPTSVGVEVVDFPDLGEAAVGYMHKQRIGGASTGVETLAMMFQSPAARLRCQACEHEWYAVRRKDNGDAVGGHLCYQCPRTDDAQACTEHRTREAHLLPWARTLFGQLEALMPSDFDAMKASFADDARDNSPDALASVERNMERAEQLFMWGHWNADRYQAERERLEALRSELAAVVVTPRVQFHGLLQAWDHGDGIARREMLAAFFDYLHVSDGQIIGYTARADREAEVLQIMEALRRRVINVGGDGFEPTASSV